MCTEYMWQNAHSKYAIRLTKSQSNKKVHYLCFNLQFCNYKGSQASFHVFIVHFYFGAVFRDREEKELSKDVVSLGVWLQPGPTSCCGAWVATVTAPGDKGVVLLYSHASQSLTRGWCRVVSYLLRWRPFTEDSSLEKGTVVISLLRNHTAAGRRMHSLLTGQGTAATASPAVTKTISLCVAPSANHSRALDVF